MNKESILKYIQTQKNNLAFIEHQIKLQCNSNYNPYKTASINYGFEFNKKTGFKNKYQTISTVTIKKHYYTTLDLKNTLYKIKKAKQKLTTLTIK